MKMTAKQIAKKLYNAYVARIEAKNEAEWNTASSECEEYSRKLADEYNMFAIITVGREPELVSF